MTRQASEGTLCRSMSSQSQHRLPAACLHFIDHHIWGITPRFLLSANLPEEPGWSPHCSPSQSHHWKSHPSQTGASGDPPNGNLGDSAHGPQKDWILDELNLQGLEDWSNDEQKPGQEAADQMGTPVCWQWPEPGKDIPNQTSDQIDWLDTFQRVLPSNTPTAVLVWKKDRSLRKLNNQTVKDTYLLPHQWDPQQFAGVPMVLSLNLQSKYCQVKVDKESKLLITFTVEPLGLYECGRMPFGLTNAPATFQQLMETCLRDLKCNWCII